MSIDEQAYASRAVTYYVTCVLQGIASPEEATGYLSALFAPKEGDELGETFFEINTLLTREAIYTCLNNPDLEATTEEIMEIWEPMPKVSPEADMERVLEDLGFPKPVF